MPEGPFFREIPTYFKAFFKTSEHMWATLLRLVPTIQKKFCKTRAYVGRSINSRKSQREGEVSLNLNPKPFTCPCVYVYIQPSPTRSYSTHNDISGDKIKQKRSNLYFYRLALLLFFPIYNTNLKLILNSSRIYMYEEPDRTHSKSMLSLGKRY